MVIKQVSGDTLVLPGQRYGHKLAWLERSNLTPAGQRMVRDC